MTTNASPTDAAADDWAAAMAEQAGTGRSNAAPATAARAPVFEQLAATPTGPANSRDIDLVLDIPVQMTVELGRTRLPIKQILGLAQGSVVELDNLAGEPMDVLVNGCLIAQGEVVVVNEKLGIRLTDIVTPAERIRRLNH